MAPFITTCFSKNNILYFTFFVCLFSVSHIYASEPIVVADAISGRVENTIDKDSIIHPTELNGDTNDYYLGKVFLARAREEFKYTNIDSAIFYSKKSIEIFDRYPDSTDFFIAHYVLGNIYLSRGNYFQGLFEFNTAINSIENNFTSYLKRDSETVYLYLANCFTSIGIVYENLNDSDRAIDSYQKGLKIVRKFNSRDSQILYAKILTNLGVTHYGIDDYVMARNHIEEAIDKFQLLGMEHALAADYRILSMISYREGNFDEVDKYLSISTQKFNLNGEKLEVIKNNFWKAKCEIKQKRYKEAEQILVASIQEFETSFPNYNEAEFHELLSEVYVKLGDYPKANHHLTMVLEDSRRMTDRMNIEMVNNFLGFYTRKNQNLRTQIENLKAKRYKEQLDAEIKAEKRKKQWILLLLFVVIFSLLLIIFVVYTTNRKNRAIMGQLRNSIEEKEVLFREVHHRVKNNFQIISSLLNLQQNIGGSQSSKKALGEAQGRINSMSLVHELLYKKDKIKQIQFKSYVEELVSSIVESSVDSEVNNIEYNVICENEYFDLDIIVPIGLILNESITNSIKYAFIDSNTETGEITISLLRRAEGQYTMIIKDNGCGIPAEFMDGSNETLGIELIRILSEQLGGHANIRENKGTEVIVDFKS